MLKSTYIGETSRGGPEKKIYNQDPVHSILISKKYLPGAVVRLVNGVLAH